MTITINSGLEYLGVQILMTLKLALLILFMYVCMHACMYTCMYLLEELAQTAENKGSMHEKILLKVIVPSFASLALEQ